MCHSFIKVQEYQTFWVLQAPKNFSSLGKLVCFSHILLCRTPQNTGILGKNKGLDNKAENDSESKETQGDDI